MINITASSDDSQSAAAPFSAARLMGLFERPVTPRVPTSTGSGRVLLVLGVALVAIKGWGLAAGDEVTPHQHLVDLLDFAACVAFVLAVTWSIRRHVKASVTDGLTGMLNRHGLNQFLRRSRACFMPRARWLSTIAIDLDNFKSINDTRGHAAGDEVLRQVSSIIHRSVRRDDTVVRNGGDEFIVILQDASPRVCRLVARRIQRLTRTCLREQYQASVSIGALSCWGTRFSYEKLFEQADALLYHAKKHGRDRIVFKATSGVKACDTTIVME